jgi:hypothetical protein
MPNSRLRINPCLQEANLGSFAIPDAQDILDDEPVERCGRSRRAIIDKQLAAAMELLVKAGSEIDTGDGKAAISVDGPQSQRKIGVWSERFTDCDTSQHLPINADRVRPFERAGVYQRKIKVRTEWPRRRRVELLQVKRRKGALAAEKIDWRRRSVAIPEGERGLVERQPNAAGQHGIVERTRGLRQIQMKEIVGKHIRRTEKIRFFGVSQVIGEAVGCKKSSPALDAAK